MESLELFVGYRKEPPFYGEQARWFSHLMEPVHATISLDAATKRPLGLAFSPPDFTLDDTKVHRMFTDVENIGYDASSVRPKDNLDFCVATARTLLTSSTARFEADVSGVRYVDPTYDHAFRVYGTLKKE